MKPDSPRPGSSCVLETSEASDEESDTDTINNDEEYNDVEVEMNVLNNRITDMETSMNTMGASLMSISAKLDAFLTNFMKSSNTTSAATLTTNSTTETSGNAMASSTRKRKNVITPENPVTTNRYAVLNSDVNLSEVKKRREIAPQETTNSTNTGTSCPGPAMKKAKSNNSKFNLINSTVGKSLGATPPLIAYNLNVKTFNNLCRGLEISYVIKNTSSSTRHIIRPTNDKSLKSILQILKQLNIQFYTYTPSEARGLTLILKGIPMEYNKDELSQFFQEANVLESIQNITHFPIKKYPNLNYYIIKLKPDADVSKLTNIKYIFSVNVTFDKFTRLNIIQCYNCQRLGHASLNCHMNKRCLKCGLTHTEFETCQVTIDGGTQPLCVLCNQQGHTANYKGCPFFKEVNKKYQLKKFSPKQSLATKVVVDPNRFNSLTRPHISYADILTGTKPPNSSSQASANLSDMLSVIDKLSLELFGCPYVTLKLQYTSLINIINTSHDANVKQAALLKFIEQTSNGP